MPKPATGPPLITVRERFRVGAHWVSSANPSQVRPTAAHVSQAGRFVSHLTCRRLHVLQLPRMCVRRGLDLEGIAAASQSAQRRRDKMGGMIDISMNVGNVIVDVRIVLDV